MKLLIGITGPARSGKDTVAAYLGKAFGFTRVALADPLRKFVGDITGLTFEQLMDSPEKDLPHPALFGRTPRFAMQTLGTEWGRMGIGENLWTNLAITNALKIPGSVVIPDIRFENEAQAVRDAGGFVVHLSRDLITKVDAHSSEAGVRFNIGDVRVHNGGSIASLEDLVEHKLERLNQYVLDCQ